MVEAVGSTTTYNSFNDPHQGYYFENGQKRFYQRELDYLKNLGYSFKSIGDNLWEAIK